MLDDAGFPEIRIMASGGLDERSIARLVEAGAPIDAFGVGTRFGTSADAPYIDSVYKLVEIDGRPVTKLSTAKVTRPWAKQVFRRFEGGQMSGDILARADAHVPRDYPNPLLETVMSSGKRLVAEDSIATVRKRVASGISSIPPEVCKLDDPALYSVTYSDDLAIPG